MSQPTPPDIVRVLAPWFPSFSGIAQEAETDVLRAVGILGLPRLVERAGDFHRAMRSRFRAWCDETDGIFRLAEEPEGVGLDYLVCELISDKPFLIRFGRFNGHRVKRNDSDRQKSARSCGLLSSEFIWPELDEPPASQLVQVSLVYTIADEGTRGGVPAWFVEELVLGVERFDGFDRLARVDRYNRPASITQDVRRAVAQPKPNELAEWRRQIAQARKVS